LPYLLIEENSGEKVGPCGTPPWRNSRACGTPHRVLGFLHSFPSTVHDYNSYPITLVIFR